MCHGTNQDVPVSWISGLNSPWWLSGEESAFNTGAPGLISGLGRFPWRRAWKPAPVFLSGESDGQGSLVGYSPWGREELDMPENALTFTAVRTRESPKAEWPEAVRVMRLRWGSGQ